ncbi:MAG: sulfatase [Planctomycetaceae bacterium]|nr:sulfatase [Planctomycetaceae bacterium]
MKRFNLLAIIALALFTVATSHAADTSRPPNIVLILMDDMGWRDVGFMGNKFVETPHIDALAERGLVFTQSYSSAPNCAPTRACLMSGQFTPRHGIYTVVDPRQPAGSPWHKIIGSHSESDLSTENVTIAEALQQTGYATGFFGMWNLGRGRSGPVTPGGQGFDTVVFPETIGFAKDAYFDDDGQYLSDRLTDEVLKFIDKNRDRPFFAYYPDHAVHAPYEPKAKLLKKYEQKAARSQDDRDNSAYAATIEAVDDNVGRIVERLEQLQLTDNTLVIFTSDNGGTQQYTAPLRGSKGQLYEGGIRVPAVVAGAGVSKPGTKCNDMVATVDWYPTLLELARAKSPTNKVLDGVSLLPVMQGAAETPRSRMFWHFPCYVGKATPSSAIRDGDWKLIEFYEDGGHRELYNLRTDPGEEHDLAKSQPDKAAALYRTLQTWQQDTGAAIPRDANPAYDPKAERMRGNQGGGGPQKGKGKGKSAK